MVNIVIEIFLGIFMVIMVMVCFVIAYIAYKEKSLDSFSRFCITSFMIIGALGLLYSTYIDITNPCVEFEDECEIECWGEGTDAYDCECIYPCKKRKFDLL